MSGSSYIIISKAWEDEDITEYAVVSTDGCSTSCIKVYSGQEQLEEIVRRLSQFRMHVHGGLYDLELGKFGREYANGALHARLHFYPPGRSQVIITVTTEGAWYDFGLGDVATRGLLHLRTEPGLLDNFVVELSALASGIREAATLRCI